MFIIHYSNALVQLYLGIPVGILIFIRILNSFFCQPLFSTWNMPTQVVVFYLNSFQNDCRFGTIFWNSIIFWFRCTKVQICSNFFYFSMIILDLLFPKNNTALIEIQIIVLFLKWKPTASTVSFLSIHLIYLLTYLEYDMIQKSAGIAKMYIHTLGFLLINLWPTTCNSLDGLKSPTPLHTVGMYVIINFSFEINPTLKKITIMSFYFKKIW